MQPTEEMTDTVESADAANIRDDLCKSPAAGHKLKHRAIVKGRKMLEQQKLSCMQVVRHHYCSFQHILLDSHAYCRTSSIDTA